MGASPEVGATRFARGRHTPEGSYSHFEGSWDELAELVVAHFENAAPGNREGVVLVRVPPERFRSSVVAVGAGTELVADFYARAEGEEPFLRVRAVADKAPARFVEVVLYRRDLVDDEFDADDPAEWGIVSVNASPTDDASPMDPVAMARNFLELPGGTKTDYSPEEFAQAIIWYSRHCHRLG